MSGSLQTIQTSQAENSTLMHGRYGVVLTPEHLNDSDYLLARAAAKGSTSALGELYSRHSGRVYALALRMTRNAADAEDLTQEVFIHLLRKIGTFRGDSRFTTWLHRLTANLVLMHFRSPTIRRELQIIDDTSDAVFARGQRVSNAQLVDRVALKSALARLPAGCRSVFVLFVIEGHRHDEIANLLGCSIGTSKSQLYRARIKLRRFLRSKLC